MVILDWCHGEKMRLPKSHLSKNQNLTLVGLVQAKLYINVANSDTALRLRL